MPSTNAIQKKSITCLRLKFSYPFIISSKQYKFCKIRTHFSCNFYSNCGQMVFTAMEKGSILVEGLQFHEILMRMMVMCCAW